MAYKNLHQAMALSRRQTQQVGIILPDIPQLNGRLAQIDPTGTAEFNAVFQRLIRNLAEQIQRIPVEEQVAAMTQGLQAMVDAAVQTAVAAAVANLQLVTNITYVTNVGGTFQSNVGPLADPNGLVSGNVGDLYKSDPAKGGTGEGFTKCEGNGTTTNWR